MITFSNQFYSKYYYGRRATLSIGNILLLRGILEGAIVCNVEHHIGWCLRQDIQGLCHGDQPHPK